MEPGLTLQTDQRMIEYMFYKDVLGLTLFYSLDGKVVRVAMPDDREVVTTVEVVNKWLKSLDVIVQSESVPAIHQSLEHLEFVYELSRNR